MSASDMAIDESLLGHDEEQVDRRWRQHGAARHFCSIFKTRVCVKTFVGTLLIIIPSSIVLILYLQWYPALEAWSRIQPQLSGHVTTTGPERDLKLLLHPEDHVSRDAGVRHFSWNITTAAIAPDGVQKDVFLINNHFPGPTIEARSGDILEIEVLNLAEEEVSLHWHGLHMRGANHMDGPIGITQCGIKPGGRYTYQVPIDDQAGTFWYHAHSEVQRGDGLYGGLVVHNPSIPENISYRYDKELLFLVSDWYHWPSAKVLSTFMSRTSEGIEKAPDSLLINGRGYFECHLATHGAPVDCTEIERPWLSLNKQYHYRVRLINVGSLTGISFSIPDSEMTVIQVDGGLPVISHVANSVGVLYPAERVDFVVAWPESSVNTKSEIMIELDKEYFLRPNFALTPVQAFLLSAESADQQPKESITEIHRFNLREAKGPPLASPLPDAGRIFMIYTAVEILNHLNGIPKGFINHTTWEPQALPLVSLNRDGWNSHQLVPWTGSEPVWIELTINNIDGTGHPYHLHGFDFYVIASYEGHGGWDYYNPFDSLRAPRGGPFNFVDPICKDTVYVPPWGYVVIRFLADNEGIWALHCHIMWHQASGMSMAFQVLGDERQGFSNNVIGSSAEQLCAS